MEWMLMPLKRYADFKGRARRKEYWMFTLGVVIVYVVMSILSSMFAPSFDPNTGAVSGGGMASILGIVMLVFWLGILVPSVAVAARRMHDVGKSGWFMLIPIYSLILACTDGEKGDNQYGPDPKGAASAGTFE
ncbi:MAG: DUF805 domain-containing protein [Alteraurantiacibacter sp.]